MTLPFPDTHNFNPVPASFLNRFRKNRAPAADTANYCCYCCCCCCWHCCWCCRSFDGRRRRCCYCYYEPREFEPSVPPPAPPAPTDSVGGLSATDDGVDGDVTRSLVDDELDWKWILNLSMHFRDQSDREKFFVTYAETPTLRRRLTVSCDYRDAEEGTLERELAMLRYQRDKSAKIYDAIRDSLTDIQFYDTITNLKLQTSDGRLHVHVTEDLHEIIPYPPVVAIAHLRCPKYKESELQFDSHLSGFVYKVKVNGDVFIKKEIPGPDTVDEFLYEINALYALADANNVIRFGGCVVDEDRKKVKGLLISFASKGALIDIIYHERGRLTWETREKWAKQIVSGLSEVHEAGYVQGDFTLSNIVIDENDDAKIIDINRRGCPVGWEPPEVTAMIDGLQRIGMYIGVKSDIFQLGMVLWGIAHEMDEPEAVERPLGMGEAPGDVPDYFRDIVEACLSERPQGRPSAKDLISLFHEHNQPSRHCIEEMPHYGEGPGPFAAMDERGYFPIRYPMRLGQPYEAAPRGNGGQSMPEVNRNGGIDGTDGLLLNGKLSQSSNSTYTPFPPQELSNHMTGSRRPLVDEAARSDSSNGSRRPISRDSFEDAPQVIEAAPSEASGEEPYIPNNIESVIGLLPASLPPPPPPQPFVRPPLERFSTANDHFGDESGWPSYAPAPQPRRLPSSPSWRSGNVREDYMGRDPQGAESSGNSPISPTSPPPPPLPLPIPTTGPGLAV
ncbi:kinase-like protein [Tuber magnatum]|uniref:Kinase-like protein n=1 Tax=Tuber magnatum TaxID=42249 RepID=A0A317SIW6_9PEZI|nr:kinase-like protein [Tuber magnatum]